MSTRAMAARYSGSDNNSQQNSGGGLMGLIAALTGQNSITGGNLTTTPEGAISGFTNFQGSPGFFGARSRNTAALLNAQVMPQIAETINRYHEALLAAQTDKEKTQLVESTKKELANIAAKSALDVTQQQGTNATNLETKRAKYKYAEEKGIPPETNTTSLENPFVNNLLARANLEHNSLGAPGTQGASDIGLQASLSMPAAQSEAIRRISVPESGTVINPGPLFGNQTPSIAYGSTPLMPANIMSYLMKDQQGNPMPMQMMPGSRQGSFVPGSTPIPQNIQDNVLGQQASNPWAPLSGQGNLGPALSTPEQQKAQAALQGLTATPDNGIIDSLGSLLKHIMNSSWSIGGNQPEQQ